jgi:PAS domain S-box-containing protein
MAVLSDPKRTCIMLVYISTGRRWEKWGWMASSARYVEPSMDDARKTKVQLIAELVALRRQLARLETTPADEQVIATAGRDHPRHGRQEAARLAASDRQLAREISGRQQAEVALEREHAFVSAILDTVGALVVVLDTQGRIIRFNRACERTTGYTAAEVLGRCLWDLLLLPEEVAAVKTVFTALRDRHGPSTHTNHWTTRAGQRRLVIWSNTTLLDDRGKVEYIIGTGIDITESARIEEAFLQSEARMRGVVETAVDGIITIDEQGHIESFNPAAERMFGYTASEVLGQNINMLMPSPYREQHDAYLERYLRTGERKIIGIGREVTGQRKDGTTFPMELAVGETYVGERRIFTGIARDISERKRAAEEMYRADRLALVGQLTSGLAHEIGTPLNVIAGNAELLRMELQEHGLAIEPLETIIAQADRITGLIGQLLSFARARERAMESLALHEPLAQALRLLETRFKREAITTIVEVPADLPMVWGIAHQIEQVFLNLLVNAWHAMSGGGTVTIRAGVDRGQHVWIAFSDTGVGMSKVTVARAFEPFYSTKEDRGTGLGLTMCQQIVENHHGRIYLESAPGAGTTVTVVLLPADMIKRA